MTIATAQYLPTVVSGSSWTDPNNVKLDDDLFAFASASRALDYPYGYENTTTGDLIASSFTGITTGMGIGDTIEGIEVEVRAKSSRSDVDTYLSVRANPYYGDERSQKISSEWAVYTFGSSSDWFGVDDSLSFVNTASLSNFVVPTISAAMATGTGSVSVSIEYIKLRVYYRATTCTAFSFSATTNAPIDQWVYSDVVSIGGLPAMESVPWTFYSGNSDDPRVWYATEVSQNNSGEWSSQASGTTKNGDCFRLRAKFRASNPNAVSVTGPSINGFTATWSVQSVAVDRTPSVFPSSTERIIGVPRSQWMHGGNLMVRDVHAYSINTVGDGTFGYFDRFGAVSPSTPDVQTTFTDSLLAPFHLFADEVPVTRGPYTDEFTWPVWNGTEIDCSILSSAGFSETTYLALACGSAVVTLYEFVTEAEDLTPNQVFFTTPSPVAVSTVATSNTVTIAGINGTATVTFFSYNCTSQQWQKNGGAWTGTGTPLTVVNGDTIAVRCTAPAGASTTFTMVAFCGGVVIPFNCVTTGGDVTPDAFTFTAATNQLPGALVVSNAITVAGMTAAQTTYATVTGGADVRVNSGAWTNGAAGCVNGNTVDVRVRAGLLPGEVKTVTVTIGGTQSTFSVTTRTPPLWD